MRAVALICAIYPFNLPTYRRNLEAGTFNEEKKQEGFVSVVLLWFVVIYVLLNHRVSEGSTKEHKLNEIQCHVSHECKFSVSDPF